jgi:hypothetical protein
MATRAEARRAPTHLWLVGILALLWSAMGCYDYWMTMSGNQAYLAKYPADAMAYMNALPKWTVATWAVGVWGGLAGALLLLARSRYAVWAFMLSAIGAVVGIGYQMFMTTQPASMKTGAMAAMPLVIIALCLFFLWYSYSEQKKGTLR